MKRLWGMLLMVISIIGITSCQSDASVASYNLSQDADNFRIIRRVVFYNGITGEWILSVEGRCSIEVDSVDKQLELTVKTGENTYKKHFLGLSDNVTYFAEQLENAEVDVYHYKVIFKPEVILPTMQVNTSK